MKHFSTGRMMKFASTFNCLKICRLRQLGLKTGNAALWSLLAVEQSCMQDLRSDLHWLHHLTQARSKRPPPDANPDFWQDLMVNHREAWQGLLKKARQHTLAVLFLICRRARRQRSQSPDLGTLEIDKHFELYNEYH